MPTSETQTDEKLILRRVRNNGMAMATLHPIIGPMYWYFVDESSNNAPNFYGLTDDIGDAEIFQSDHARWSKCGLFRSNLLTSGSPDEWVHSKFKQFAKRAGVSAMAFHDWVGSTPWVEFPAPCRTDFLADFNGHVGYKAEWTDTPERSMTFTQQEIDADELDAMLAKSLGTFVRADSAWDNLPQVEPAKDVNHALNARVDWAFHALGNGHTDIDHKSRALSQAASAGRIAVAMGDDTVSPHLQTVPELLAAFQMAAGLVRHGLYLAAASDSARVQNLN